jgi:DNA mismatch repair protein MutL
MKIKILTPATVNKIAAGEVIDRPLSVLKELVENSLDAEATNITIQFERGGRNLISVADDGQGIIQEDLNLAFMRHATSKLPEEDLSSIKSLGFRGEALASILAAAKVKIKSRVRGGQDAYGLTFEEGFLHDKEPELIAYGDGTKVEVWDLFSFMPNKLRFLKSEQAELLSAIQMIEALSLAYPETSFTFFNKNKPLLDFRQEESLEERIEKVMGQDFMENAIFFEEEKEIGKIFGYLSIPSYNRKKANKSIIFVNKRLVKDPFLQKIIRAAYQNSLPDTLLPSSVIFIEVPSKSLEVNVHPTKSLVLFEKESLIRDLVIHSMRKGLEASKTSNNITENFLQAFQPLLPFDFLSDQSVSNNNKLQRGYLGLAQFQLDNKYIFAANNDTIIIVDQHAAHERIVLENMKKNKVLSEKLLIPLEFNFSYEEIEVLLTLQQPLLELGIEISSQDNKLLVLSYPLLLGGFDLEAFFYDLILDHDDLVFNNKISKIFAKLSCYSSIRAGKKLNQEEMNALLRLIEETNLGSHCLHGRPTYVEIKLNQLDRIFERR